LRVLTARRTNSSHLGNTDRCWKRLFGLEQYICINQPTPSKGLTCILWTRKDKRNKIPRWRSQYNPILFAICTSTFSRLCKNMYTLTKFYRHVGLSLVCR
jgi:hypothetical protein